MTPAASVSGLYFSHPEARYFAVDLVTRDLVREHRGEHAPALRLPGGSRAAQRAALDRRLRLDGALPADDR